MIKSFFIYKKTSCYTQLAKKRHGRKIPSKYYVIHLIRDSVKKHYNSKIKTMGNIPSN